MELTAKRVVAQESTLEIKESPEDAACPTWLQANCSFHRWNEGFIVISSPGFLIGPDELKCRIFDPFH